MKFEEIKYQRVNIEEFREKSNKIFEKLGTGNKLSDEIKAIKAFQDLSDDIESETTIASVRNSINTLDEFYDKEIEFYDENGPFIQEISNEYTKRLLSSDNLNELKKEFGELLFSQEELALKTFDPKIIEDLQKENKLTTDYNKLIASAQINYDGKVLTLSQMSPYTQNIDRNIRKESSLLVSNFFETNLDKFETIYDELVRVRTSIAKKLGYDNFINLAYDRLGRTDYNSSDVSNYRKQIIEEVVPFVSELEMRKAERLGINNPQSFDLALSFLSGNPTPKGNREWQVKRALEMYSEMSIETKNFFEFMLDNNLLDLDSKEGKQAGGYCTYIPKYESPFIFANFNGTSHDVDVLTHEAGHAFQVYQSRHLIPEYRWPTMEAAEIHSMSMEFLAWPWIDKFFEEDTDKYKFSHLAGAVTFIPYGALVDHFQHEVYENYNLTKEERRALWRTLEKTYLPHKKYEEDKFLENGGFWFRQGHIFDGPFYYIDYTLAQVVALEYWNESRKDFDNAFNSYLSLCKLGGSKSFLGLLKTNNLSNPFKEGTIKKIFEPVKEYLNSIDDKKL